MEDLNRSQRKAVGGQADGESVEKLRSEVYKCPNCGNFLYFDPDSNKLKCDYCGGEQELEAVKYAEEIPYHDGVEEEFERWQGVKSVRCRSCGAVCVLPEYEVVANCPFCNASNVVVSQEIDGLRPNGILPFKISRREVPKLFSDWLRRRSLAPGKLKKTAGRQPCSGVYVPVFTFDSDVKCEYSIRYGKHYTVTVGSGKNRHVETRTRWYTDHDLISNFFNDIQVEASKSITQSNLKKLGGFDTDNAYEYHSQFLSGYKAERYDRSLDGSWTEAKTLIQNSLRSMIVSRYNADVVDYVRMNCDYSESTYKYVLVPIWVFNYIYAKKNYACIVNGRSGRMIGKYPKSPIKVGSIALAVGAAIVAIILLYFKFIA